MRVAAIAGLTTTAVLICSVCGRYPAAAPTAALTAASTIHNAATNTRSDRNCASLNFWFIGNDSLRISFRTSPSLIPNGPVPSPLARWRLVTKKSRIVK